MEPQKHEELDEIILKDFPTPIAVLYNKLLQEERWELKTGLALELFELWMKSVTLQMLIQYLDQDIKSLHNEDADKLNAKIKSIYKPSLGDIVDLFFSLLKAYYDHPELLFMKELFNIQWQAGTKKKISGARDDFDAFTKIRNDIAHGRRPRSEAAWKIKYEKVDELLSSVLSRFQFVKDYRIVYGLEATAGKGTFLVLCGLEPARIELGMPKTESIRVGRFYLDCCGDPGRFYELHPLFLPWPSDFLDWKKQGNYEDRLRQHTAIYEWYQKPTVHFSVHTEDVEELVLKDPEAITRFLELFEEALKKIQPARTIALRLHWRQFQHIASQITQLETEAIRGKFSKDLYLQRQHIKSAFEHFLKSDKVAFVLLGQSGVGKSNFVLSMHEAYRESQDTYLSVFNSARLSGEGKLVVSLTEMFVSKIALVDKTNKERKVEDILEEINNIDEIWKKKVILAFDAINENSRPHELLKHIDDLVSYNKYPWLKVMITSRPEAWQSMKRQYHITESRYYRQPDTEELEMELKGFDQQATSAEGWLAMDPFKPVELPEVYTLYQDKYHLQTNFEGLSPEMKVMLRDPLALRLVAEIYGYLEGESKKDGILPEHIHTSKLYEQYIHSLIDDGRLERVDVEVFLKQKLLPLMFRPGAYRNTLDAEILTRTIGPTSGKSLSEEIELTDIVPSTGKRVNQSFQNLTDAGILVKQGSYSDYEIGFKYERFYDYFGGEYLYTLNKKKEEKEKEGIYKELVNQLHEFPFLWGSIKNALLNELIMGAHDLIDELAKEQDQSIRELLIAAITELGQESGGGKPAEKIVDHLLQIERQRAGFGRWIRIKLTGTDARPLSKAAQSASKTALEVARRLGLSSTLKTAALDTSPAVRILAARNIYHLWRNNPKEGFAILENIVDQATDGNGLPNIAAVEASLALAVLMMRYYYPDTEDGRALGHHIMTQMRKIIRRVFFVSEKGGMWRRLVVPAIRNVVVNAVIRFIVKTQEDYPEDKPSFLNEVGDLIHSPADVKAKYDRLVDYFENPVGLEKIREDLREAVVYNDTLTNGVAWLIIVSDFLSGRETDYSILEESSSLELNQRYVGITNEGMIIAIGLVSSAKKEFGDKLFDQLRRMTFNYIEKTKGFYYSRSGTRHPNLAINPYMTMRRLRQNPTDPDLVAYFLEKAMAEPDWTFFNMLLDSLVTQASNSDDWLNCRMALQSLKVVFPIHEKFKGEENIETIEEKIITTLARMRLYNRNEVDNFLLEMDTENKILPRVLRIEPEEKVWAELFHNIYATILVRLIQTPEIKNELIAILRQATRQESLGAYLKWVVRDLMNLLSDEQIFKVEKA